METKEIMPSMVTVEVSCDAGFSELVELFPS